MFYLFFFPCLRNSGSHWIETQFYFICVVVFGWASLLLFQLAIDKNSKGKGKNSRGKGKGKGKGKKAAASPSAEVSAEESAVSRCQDALSALGGEVTGLLKALTTTLKVRRVLFCTGISSVSGHRIVRGSGTPFTWRALLYSHAFLRVLISVVYRVFVLPSGRMTRTRGGGLRWKTIQSSSSEGHREFHPSQPRFQRKPRVRRSGFVGT